jgi:general secretion pathway protein K
MRTMRTQRGVALVTAVMIVAIAAAIAAQVAFAHQIWLRQMENVADRGATDWLRRGALHWASTALIDDAAKSATDHLGERWAMGLPVLPVEGGAISVSIEDAQSRLNLNSVGGKDTTSLANFQFLTRLLEVLQLDPQLANAVVDWIDSDTNVSAGGAEDIDYLNLNPPYRAANRLLASVDELRLVRGFDAKTVAALLPYVTVLPVASNIINVNTASPVVLAALVQGLDLPTAQRIADERRSNPFKDINAFTSKLPRGPTPPTGGMSLKSDFFLVTLETSIRRHQRRSEALLQRSGTGTIWLWHRPLALIGPDEADDSR